MPEVAPTSVISTGCGAICRGGGVQLITTSTDPDGGENTAWVVKAALRLLEAIMTVEESTSRQGADDHHNIGGGEAPATVKMVVPTPILAQVGCSDASSAAAAAASTARGRVEVCSSEALRRNLVRLVS